LEENLGPFLPKIISGGQSGVDRAALDVALDLGIPCGGWCPKARKAEDGPIDSRYPLKETDSPNYPVRTEINIRESDGTLVLTEGSLIGGTALTVRLARKNKKPFLVIRLDQRTDPLTVRVWIEKNNLKILNVAGPRESEVPGIHDRAVKFIHEMITITD
jgi:hypothetical protein